MDESPDLFQPGRPDRPDHSGLGIAGFVMGLMSLAGAFLLAFLILAGIGGRTLMAMGICGGWVFALVGMGLGIAGLAQSRRKALSALGVLFNFLFISVSVVLFLVVILSRPEMAGGNLL